MKHYDVIIVGGGMVGALSALSLAELPLKIALIEGTEPLSTWSEKSFDTRVSAITRASETILRRLGVWSSMERLAVHAYSDMHVWDSGGSGQIHFDCADIGEVNLGHIVENRVIQFALWEKLKSAAAVDILCPARATKLIMQPESVSLSFSDQDTVSATLLIAADGGRSWVREQSGIEVEQGDYQQIGMVTTVKTEKFHQNTAWQRFLPAGPVAYLPLRDGYSSIVWSSNTDQAETLLALDDDNFSRRLSAALQGKLGAITDIRDRAGFPLHHMHAKTYIKPRLALIGDAAHTIHPLAGQGVNLGFADAACLRDVIADALINHRDWGNYGVLRRYERWRRGENSLSLKSMSAFKQLFGSPEPIATTFRNLGLDIGQRITPLRNEITRFAMGLRGDLSSLARPRVD